MSNPLVRTWLIRWLYLLTFGHFAGGVLLVWFFSLSFFDHYHQSILNQIGDCPSTSGVVVKFLWCNLTKSCNFYGVLTYLGNKQRSALIWVWMIAGLILWAPQDMLISLQVNLWLHVWVDSIVLLVLPPLILLWWHDRKSDLVYLGK